VLPVVLALFAAYAFAVTWQMRRAVRASDPVVRQREAVRLLVLVSVGAPLAAVLILVAL
jgi:hypothetical protein